ncbi:DUF5320 family protein [Patescibacteria group bacterium]
MPSGDQTGPLGLGAGTGRGRGACGIGSRAKKGLRLRNCLSQRTPSLATLEQEEKLLEEELAAVRQEKKTQKKAK